MTLYKYLSFERVDVLRDREIRFTQAAALNDPFELKPYFESFFPDSELRRRLASHPIDVTQHVASAYQRLSAAQRAKMSPESFADQVCVIMRRPDFQER